MKAKTSHFKSFFHVYGQWNASRWIGQNGVTQRAPQPPPLPPRKDFWSFLITPFPSLTEMSSSFNQVQVAPCKQILVPESIREIMPVETGIRNPASDRNPMSTVEKLIGPSKIHCNGNRNPQPGIQYVLDWLNGGDTRFDCACVVCLKTGSGRACLDIESRVKFITVHSRITLLGKGLIKSINDS